MADASNLQSSFLGGEWSPYAQGRAEDKEYRSALSVCRNAYPIEDGAWMRRQGFRFCATTRYGQPAWLLPFAFNTQAPYQMEFTQKMLRLFNGPLLVSDPTPQLVASASSASPTVITTRGAHGWSGGDQVQFLFSQGRSYPLAAALMNRQFAISDITTSSFTLYDPITGAPVDGSTITLPGSVAQVVKVTEIASPYTAAQLTSINRIQAEGVVATLAPGVAPWALTALTQPSAAAFATFSYAAAVFTDGPYMDPAKSGTLTPSAKTGSITLSGAPANTFAATDVGRFVRLYSEPAAWAVGTAYSAGNPVKFTDGLYYVALASTTGNQPDVSPTQWGLSPTSAIWTWAKITAYGSGTSVTATIMGADLLYTSPAIATWRLGLYSATTGYPTCGLYHEGRLWLGGAIANRFDASATTDNPFDMTPTAADGTVADSNAISYVLNAEDVNQILWMSPDNGGIVMGTAGGEWMVAASALTDPLTPTSVQAHRRSKYKCANVQPVNCGISLLFVQAKARKLMEYVADVFSGKFLGRNMNEKTKHLTTTSVAQLGYQQELAPIVWGRTGAGGLIGTTYKRESSFTSEGPTFNAWHRHDLGSGRVVESISVGPSVDGDLDTLAAVTNDPNTNVRHVEMLTDMFDEKNTITDAWFLDDAVTPTAAVENSAATSINFYGMTYLAGFTVSAWAGGLDLGDYVVAADGSITVPINSATNAPLFTDAYLTALAASGEDFGGLGVFLNRSVTVLQPTPAITSIQSYIPTTVATNNSWVADDYEANETYTVKEGVTTAGAIEVFNRFTGARLRGTNASTLFPGTIFEPSSSTIYFSMVLSDKYILMNSGANNAEVLRRIDRKTLKLTGSFGLVSGFASNDSQKMYNMGAGVVLKVGGKDYMVHVGRAAASLGVIDIDTMTWAGHAAAFTEGSVSSGICAGENINGGPTTYAAAYSLDKGTTTLGLYKTTINASAVHYFNPFFHYSVTGDTTANSGISTVRVASVAATAIDATWTNISTIIGPAYDQTDGNIIMFAQTTDSVTNQYYVLKLNAGTGAVMWATAIAAGALPGADATMCTSTIKYGTFSFLVKVSSTPTLYTVNTSSGAITATTLDSAITVGAFISNDIDGSIISVGTWTSGGSNPAPTSTTISFTSTAYRLMGYSAFPGQATDTQSVVIPVVIGFTYTSQGQRLRDLAPDASGARNGPAMGKTRRNHRYAIMCANTQGISVGSDLALAMRPAQFKSNSGKGVVPLALNQLYTGVHTDTVESDYNLDGQLCWQVTRPYPACVTAVEGMLQTQDR
jgi:uncharacterized protein YqkB